MASDDEAELLPKEESLSLLDGEEQPPRRAGRRRTVWLLLVVGVLAVILGVGGFLFSRVNQVLSSLERDPSMLPIPTGSSAPADGTAQSERSGVDFVVMGSDSRGADRGRSDVLMLAHLNAARDRLYLISFPRDMYVPIPGHGKNKINAAYSFGGSALTVKTLQNLLGIDVEHAVQIDFEGFVSLSDSIGGVTVWNRVGSASRGFEFPQGTIDLSGEKLLAYVRQRYELPRGDLDRAERQRTVLKAMIRKLMTPEVLVNPVAISNLTEDLGSNLKVDSGLTDARIWDLASSLRISGSRDVVTLQAPIEGFGRSPAGASIDLVDEKKLANLGLALKEDTMADYVESLKDPDKGE